MSKLYRLFHSMFLSSPALEDYAAMKRTLNYRHQQIYAATTATEFITIRSHIESDAERFRQSIDAGIVNSKVSYLLSLIEERTDKFKPDYSQYEYFYN